MGLTLNVRVRVKTYQIKKRHPPFFLPSLGAGRCMGSWLMHGRNLQLGKLRSSYAHVRIGQKSPVLPGSPHEKSPDHCFGLVAPLLGPKLA